MQLTTCIMMCRTPASQRPQVVHHALLIHTRSTTQLTHLHHEVLHTRRQRPQVSVAVRHHHVPSAAAATATTAAAAAAVVPPWVA